MKKYLFIIITTTILITVLIYFYDKKETILNKEYIDNNIHIEYPYFNNQGIDNYINTYLNKIIDNNPNNSKLFMDYDYDYDIQEETIALSLYTYKEKNNMISKDIKNLEVDLNANYTIHETNIKDTTLDYDIYKQKFINKNNPLIALTFDDGPNCNTNKILDILEKYNVKATFFILGTNIKGNEATIKRMNKLGMEIGNHMYSHKLITKLKNETIEKEITKVDNLIFEVVGKYPTLVRPSYGTFNKRIKSLIDRPIIIWNIDTLDWKYHNSKRISNNILKKATDGDIVLMHDIYSATANSLEITIPKLLEKGYQLVTVSDLFYYKNKNLNKNNVYSSSN